MVFNKLNWTCQEKLWIHLQSEFGLDSLKNFFIYGNNNSKTEAKMEIKPRFFQESQQSYFLFGPRGTGKSTWLKYRHPKAHLIDILDPEAFRAYSAKPERLREIVEAQEPGATIIVDEIQKLPQLLDVVHLLLETKKDRRFMLTGSSARKLKRASVDLLAGRAKESFLPSKILLLRLRRLPIGPARRSAWRSPGNRRCCSWRAGCPASPCLERIQRRSERHFFWRTKSGNEVDFVIYGENVFCALEVKSAAKVNPKMLHGLLAFKEDYPEAQLLFLYRGRERLKIKGVMCVPVQEFLMNLKPEKPLWGWSCPSYNQREQYTWHS